MATHPWRPFKQPNMFFSVEPSSYHDITSLNEQDDETPALEALPFRVCHTHVAPKKRKRKTAPAQRKESKKAKRESSDSEEPDEAYHPSRHTSTRTRKGSKRVAREVLPGGAQSGREVLPGGAQTGREVLPGGTARSRRMVMNNMTVQSAYMCL